MAPGELAAKEGRFWMQGKSLALLPLWRRAGLRGRLLLDRERNSLRLWVGKGEIAVAKGNLPFSRSEFLEQAKPVEVTIAGMPVVADVKEFSTGSVGWYYSGKTAIRVGEQPVNVQVSVTITVIGSKDLPKE
ncbi:hypothetical protein HRbin36_02631 [bacterium HR36]|nr:hypothetical protein HRbin36_02631 [bacterium HR36]